MNQKRRGPTPEEAAERRARLDAFIERLQRDPFEVIEDERAARKQYTAELSADPRFVRVTGGEGFVIGFPAGMPKAKT
jgi:hypothetical protein